MRINPLAISALALAFGASGIAIAQPSASPVAGAGYIQEGGWDMPPGEYQEVQRKGFHDGIEGARKDFENHRPPSPENRDEYRHPDVPHNARHDYRDAFRRGYSTGWQHFGGRR
jgi:hypothetical protein